MPRLLSLLLVLLALIPAHAAAQQDVALYIGPVPNPNGLTVPVSKEFADSYGDLTKAHNKLKPPQVTLVDDPAQSDAILTVTYRGEVDAASTVNMSAPIALGSSISGTHVTKPTLRARLTVRATRNGVDFSGVREEDDRTKYSTQAERIYKQAVDWLVSHRDEIDPRHKP